MAADRLVFRVGLLAERGGEDQSRIASRQRHELAQEPIHLLVAEEDRVLVSAHLVQRRFERERLRLHVPPVRVLQMRRAVDEEAREIRPQSAKAIPEDIELQLVEQRDAPPRRGAGARPLGRELAQDR